ncbi:MAG: cbb3-type cytochrome oxidase assembly protein CcoS [Alphaproteobacteria bacterium]|nr:cbb3-type cytochrome oxidase assembly protein CcoS [Alphaproteobacteria bacterium]
MTVLLFMIPVALLLGLTGLIAFIWALLTGQFDDPDGAAARVLIDSDRPINETSAAGYPSAGADPALHRP